MTMMMMLSNPICWLGYSKMHRLKQGLDIYRVAKASKFRCCVLLLSIDQV